MKPGGHVQVNDPGRLWQVELLWHGLDWHSSTSCSQSTPFYIKIKEEITFCVWTHNITVFFTAISSRAVTVVGAVLAAALAVVLARLQQTVIDGFIAITSLKKEMNFKFILAPNWGHEPRNPIGQTHWYSAMSSKTVQVAFAGQGLFQQGL